jgi:hypothetical protein
LIDLRMKRATVTELQRELEGIEPRLARRIASGVDREIAAAQERIAELDGRLELIYVRNPEQPADYQRSGRRKGEPKDLQQVDRRRL